MVFGNGHLGSIGVQPEAQGLRPDEGDQVTLTLPIRRRAEGRDQFVIGLGPCGGAVAILDLAGNEDDAVIQARKIISMLTDQMLRYKLSIE